MELLVLDETFTALKVMDSFDSVIWTDRYSECGDFEIYTSVNGDNILYLRENYYLWLADSQHVMIIEDISIDTDVEDGNHLTITGRSLESMLDRRIVWGQTILSGNFQDGIHQLLNDNIINPTIVDRRVDNFIFEASTDPNITSLIISAQFNGENLYDTIQTLCSTNNIGFRIVLTDDNKFKFQLYSGADRSYNQDINPYVVFSPPFQNIISSKYYESIRPEKTVSFVAGEGEGSDQKTTSVEAPTGGGSGLSRREMFTNASDISSTTESGTLTAEEYLEQLSERGAEDLSSNIFISSFEGQVEATSMFKYGEDFFMGDILQIANEYGMETSARVVELIHSQSLSGVDLYPTFAAIN